MSIPMTSGLVLRLEADSGIATADGAVVSWADTSGLGNHLTGAGDASFGVVMTPSGLPSIVLDGNGDKLEKVLGLNGLPAGNQDRTVFFVVDYDNPQGVIAGAVFGDNASNQTFGLAASTGGNLMVQGYGTANDFASTTNGVNGGFLVQSAVLQAGTVRQYLNGALIDTDAHNYNTDLERIVIGEEIGGAGFSAMKVGAMLVFDRALTRPSAGWSRPTCRTSISSPPAAMPPRSRSATWRTWSPAAPSGSTCLRTTSTMARSPARRSPSSTVPTTARSPASTRPPASSPTRMAAAPAPTASPTS